jgi:hypothetical protein
MRKPVECFPKIEKGNGCASFFRILPEKEVQPLLAF